MATWREDIIAAMEELGGKASYSELYPHVAKKRGQPLSQGDEAGVRRVIENHSSDSKNWNVSRPDLSYSVGGKGSGSWGLRSSTLHAANTDEVQDGAEVFIEAEEGRAKLRVHLHRERSKKLIEAFKATRPDPSCEACGMRFSETYGELGAGYIEAHHKVPVALLEKGSKTQLSDLAALCANCHRIIHKNGLMSVEDLAEALAKRRASQNPRLSSN